MIIIRRMLPVVVAVLLGFICDGAIWDKPMGIAFPVFIILSLLLSADVLMLSNTNLLPAPRSYWLFIPPVFFAFTAFFTRQYPGSLKHNLSLVFTFLYIALLSMTYLGGRLYQYSLFDFLRNFFRLIGFLIQGPIVYIGLLVRDIFFPQENPMAADATSVRFSRTISILIFAALFSLFWWADWVFREFHYALFRPSGSGSAGNAVTFWGVLIWSYLILGLILHAGTDSLDTVLTVDNLERFFRRWLNFNVTPWIVVTAALPLITFMVLRDHCFFNQSDCIGPDGFPATLEPHFGFWALTAAAVLIFLMVCWLDHVTVFQGDMDRLAHTILNIILFAYETGLLFTAYQAVSDKTWGVHAVRHIWYARAGLFWLWIIFGMFIVYEARQRERDFPFAALIVTTLMVGAYTGVMAFLSVFGIAVSW